MTIEACGARRGFRYRSRNCKERQPWIAIMQATKRSSAARLTSDLQSRGPYYAQSPRPDTGTGARATELWQIVAERREEHVVDSVRRRESYPVGTGPRVARNIRVLWTELKPAMRTAMSLDPEPHGALDKALRVRIAF